MIYEAQSWEVRSPLGDRLDFNFRPTLRRPCAILVSNSNSNIWKKSLCFRPRKLFSDTSFLPTRLVKRSDVFSSKSFC